MALLRMRPSRGLDAARLDEEVAHAAPLICTWAGGLLLVEGLAHLLILSPAYRAGMTWLTVGVGVLLLILRGVLQVRAVPRGCGHVVAFLLGVLLLVPGIALLVWSHEARHVTNFMIIVLGGAAVWLLAPSDTITIGASGMVFGFLGYLLVLGVLTRRWVDILVAVGVLLLYGSLLMGATPFGVPEGVSWLAHLTGFAAGVAAAVITTASDRRRDPA